MVAYTKPQQKKKDESEQLRGERDHVKFIDLRLERWQVDHPIARLLFNQISRVHKNLTSSLTLHHFGIIFIQNINLRIIVEIYQEHRRIFEYKRMFIKN